MYNLKHSGHFRTNEMISIDGPEKLTVMCVSTTIYSTYAIIFFLLFSTYFQKMNYYQITSGLDELDDSDDGDNDTEDQQSDPLPPATPPPLHQAVTSCLAQDTVADLAREYTRNTSSSNNSNSNNSDKAASGGVVMRRRSSRSSTSYSHRASQRWGDVLISTLWTML